MEAPTVMNSFVIGLLLLLTSIPATETSKLRIARLPNGPELSSPLVVGTRQTLNIYCTAVTTDSPGTVRGLHWRFPNNSRVPEVSIRGVRSEYDVGMVRYVDNNTWIAYLRMNRVQLSSAGIYRCVANFSGMPRSHSIEIQVSACGELGPLTNGQLRLSSLTTVTYTCDTGYSLRGPSTRHCTVNGEWTGSVPQCIPVRCVVPPAAPVHGQRNVTGLTFGSTVIYSCSTGYTLNGSSTITCMANRQWSGKAPDCSPVSCGPAPNASANGQRSAYYTAVGSTVTYTCNTGYTLQGDSRHTCMANGQWSGSTPTCSAVSCIPISKALANGEQSVSGTTFGSTVTYTCNRGYTLQGDSRRTCMANGQWSGRTPTCSTVSCSPIPEAPANGIRGVPGTTYGSTVTFACNQGYTLEGASRRTCMANRQWNGTTPTCNPICTNLCLNGGTCTAPNTCTCDVMWTGEQCERAVRCGPAPEAPVNGQRRVSGTTFGSTVTYTCNRGYTLQGDNRHTCMANSQWSGRTPICNPVSCGPAPDAPANGQRSGSGTTFGSAVTYTCNPGYTLQGDSGHTCMANGQWSGVTTRCTPTISLATISSTSPSITSILVKWAPPPSEVGGTQGFTLYWTELAGQDGGSVTTTSHYHTIVGLYPATGYSIVVQVNAVLGDMNSTAVQAYTLPEVNNTIRVVSDFTTAFEVALNLSLSSLPDNVESIAVWYSTKGHEGSPTAPPQDAHVVHGSNTSTSLKIALPDSSDPCQPYHIWVAGFVSNGQRGPYSKRRRVEVCSRTDDGQSSAAAGNCANIVSLGILGGLLAGIVFTLLIVGIVFGVIKLRRHGKVTKSAKEMKESENTYETVEPKQSAALSDHVAMETNPAYASVH